MPVPMSRCLIRLALISLALSGPVQAQKFHAIGSGSATCSSWLTWRLDPDSAIAIASEQWVLGFLSGVGYMGSKSIDPLRGIDAKAVFVWVDNYCIKEPEQNLLSASIMFRFTHSH